MLLRMIFLVLFVIPVIAWCVVKPVRIIAPELLGIKCFDGEICLDNPDHYDTAKKLREDAIAFLAENVGTFKVAPKLIFCSTPDCANTFGLGLRSAVSFGTAGSVIGAHAWKPYYVRHELLHQLQGQELGVLKCLILPTWFIEGMAYSLSRDPRQPLDSPWQDYRSQFSEWLDQIGNSSLWSEAEKL